MITAVCPNPRCRRSLSVEERSLGQRVACPHCQQPFEVAAPPAPPSIDPDATTTPWLFGSNPFGEQSSAPPTATYAPAPSARRPSPPPPKSSGPPPLPPRSPSAGPGLRTGPTIVSLVSLVITVGSLFGIAQLLRSSPEGEKPPPPPPVAERWAAITIESSGVRFVAIDAKRTPGNPELLLARATNRDWKLGELEPGLPERPGSFDDLERILAKYNEELTANGVPVERRLVACNLGVVTAAGDAGREKLQEWVRASVRKALDRDVDIIDAAQEAEYGARGSIPPTAAIRAQSVALDMGGGSTKYGYFDTPTDFKGDRFRIGVRAAEGEIGALAKSNRISFPAAARDWKATADEAVQKLAVGVPPLQNHGRYYLLGGAPWAVTVIAHPAEFAKPIDARAVDIRLSPVDIEGALKLIEEKPDFAALKAAVLAKVPGGGSGPLEDELTQIGRAFRTEQLLAGATLLKSFSDVCNFGGKEVRFYTRSLHAWPVGYILVKGKFEQ